MKYLSHKFPAGLYDSGLIRIVRLDNPDSYPFDNFHAHEYNEIIVFLKGGGRHNISFQEHRILSNSIHHLAAGDLHWMERSMASSGFAIVYHPEVLFKLDSLMPDMWFSEVFNASFIITLNKPQLQKFRFVFTELIHNQDDSENTLQLTGLLLTRMAKMMDIKPIPRSNDATIMALTKMIRNHYKDYRQLSDYASMLNTSPETLRKKIKRHLGKNFRELIDQQLLKEAEHLLIDGSDNINTIAEMLGFKEAAHFSSWFKKKTGHAPSNYPFS